MTQVGRAKLDHPALATTGGSALHSAIETIYTDVSNHLNARYKAYSGVANSATNTYEHNLGVAITELQILLYTGTHPNLTKVTDPSGSGWTISATSGFEKTKIDITAPSSGGTHTFAIIIYQAGTILTNPMTTAGDIIKGGTSGVAERLAIGTANQILKSDGTTLSWSDPDFGSKNIVTTGSITTADATVQDTASNSARHVLNTTTGISSANDSIVYQLKDNGTVGAELGLFKVSTNNKSPFLNLRNANASAFSTNNYLWFDSSGKLCRDTGSGSNLGTSTSAVFDFGGGIKLPTSGGTASTLDYYEEKSGSLTNTVDFATGSAATNTGNYLATRIGRICIMNFNVAITKSTDSGVMTFTSSFFPWTPNSNANAGCGYVRDYNGGNSQATHPVTLEITSGVLNVYINNSSGNATPVTAADIGTTWIIDAQIIYFV